MPFIPLDPRVSGSAAARDYIEMTEPYVLVVQDDTIVSNLDIISQIVAIRISCGGEAWNSWLSLSGIFSLSPCPSEVPLKIESTKPPGSELVLILFTRGTTATPKACPHTARNLWSSTFNYDSNTSGAYNERWLVHTPSFHIFAIGNALRAWRQGGCVVFGSKTFDISASIYALVHEKCTRMGAVPTLAHALLEHPSFPAKDALSLNYISLEGTFITEADVNLCKRFGSDSVLPAYGMSEGSPIAAWNRKDPLWQKGFHPGVGKVLPGCRIRICSPGMTDVLHRGDVGELHVGGTSVIEKYMYSAGSDSFYEDDKRTWLMTGDQAFINEKDVLYITGRLKDIIIRGGENIAPAKIESFLGRIPGFTVSILPMIAQSG
jgi:acyl-CoA synthetase (AMP-forming)/AMP-acid ligase II